MTAKEIEKGKYFQFCPIWEDDGRDWIKPLDSKNILAIFLEGCYEK